MSNLNGKVALVTGASRGIGFAIAKKLADEGAKVVLTGRRKTELDIAVSKIGGDAVGIASDVTSQSGLNNLFSEIRNQFGQLDILVANAGGGVHAPLGQITEEQIDKQFATNVKGVVLTMQGALAVFGASASAIIIGSSASIDPGPTMSIYGGTKAAVRNMVRSWVCELKGKGIRINVVSPGPTNTDSLREAFGEHSEEGMAFLKNKSPIGRIGEPDEIASVVAFLASDASSYVNGVELFVDGGASQI
jgi:NAD(P)-dependent dehydrogenase (short-subunit alcohol dehydrogenase family)